ncbi:GIY-YIG nuclease family protein [Nocardioides aequoreus]|uniref:GIY-YIG nuclease family protein n=1 Tax=Nocardioides aequoreus TaxID=397278 RepID=UPI0004C3C914|nr:GIY-YIG nuclease family protein [Nocardioides aequoreus]
MAWTYLLECSDGSLYVGSTTDLMARLHQHQQGLGAIRTRTRLPVRLVWSAEFETIPEAFAFEKQVRKWGRAKRLALIRGDFDALPDLASRSHHGNRRRGEYEGCAE